MPGPRRRPMLPADMAAAAPEERAKRRDQRRPAHHSPLSPLGKIAPAGAARYRRIHPILSVSWLISIDAGLPDIVAPPEAPGAARGGAKPCAA